MGELISKGSHDRNGKSASKQAMAVLNKYTCIYWFLIKLGIIIINFNTRKRWAYIWGGAYNRVNFFLFFREMGPHTKGSCNRQCTVKEFLRIALGSLACNWERQCSCFRDCRGKGGGGGGGGGSWGVILYSSPLNY